MSSHREAPEVSKDPVVDNTDTYAFVSPDSPKTVTIITNYILPRSPRGADVLRVNDVLYKVHVDNNGDGRADVTSNLGSNRRSPTRTRSVQHGPDQLLGTRAGTNGDLLPSRGRP
jgi:hypothetical protein